MTIKILIKRTFKNRCFHTLKVVLLTLRLMMARMVISYFLRVNRKNNGDKAIKILLKIKEVLLADKCLDIMKIVSLTGSLMIMVTWNRNKVLMTITLKLMVTLQ
jgi:hypothetical protein